MENTINSVCLQVRIIKSVLLKGRRRRRRRVCLLQKFRVRSLAKPHLVEFRFFIYNLQPNKLFLTKTQKQAFKLHIHARRSALIWVPPLDWQLCLHMTPVLPVWLPFEGKTKNHQFQYSTSVRAISCGSLPIKKITKICWKRYEHTHTHSHQWNKVNMQ
uniref:(northern house mosquito) hypothetical protein n=1 Tax=Culex pipiens TaxID=7175 RepID=A0A8D8BMZ1_CULPI